MKNKYQFNILILLIMALFISSCSKFLDSNPQENKYNSSALTYSDLTQMYNPVSGIYRLAGEANPGFVHWMDFGIRAIRGDDFVKGSSASDQSQLTDIQYFHNTYPSIINFWGSSNCWNDYYFFIKYANSALTELDSFALHIPSSDAANMAKYNSYKGEIRFMRAFAHLVVSRVFGNIPIVTDNVQILSAKKSTPADVRKFIISEMDACISNMEDAVPASASHIGAVTKYSALLLKAKAAADLAGSDNGSNYWDTVLDCTNQIINSGKFSLYPDYYQLFKKPGKLCTESLFELQFSDFGRTSGDAVEPDAFWAFQGPRGDQHGSAISGWGFMNPSQTFVDFLKGRNDNIRLKTTIMYCDTGEVVNRWGSASSSYNQNKYGVTASGDTVWTNSDGCKYYNGKAYLPTSQMTAGRTDYGINNNIRVLRYADVLLLNAEARIRKAQNGDVQLNLVRNRVGLSSITNATLQNVLDERRAEFGCEWWGERYNDLVRTGTASTTLGIFGFVKGTSEYLPIPQSVLDINPNLK